jgi:hypothetical protein
MPDTHWTFLKVKDEQLKIRTLMEDLENNLPSMLTNCSLSIKSEQDLLRILELRNKSYRWILHIVESLLDRSMAVRMLKSSNEQKYKEYKEAYMYFADFYLRRILDYVSQGIKKSCPLGVTYKPEYDRLS